MASNSSAAFISLKPDSPTSTEALKPLNMIGGADNFWLHNPASGYDLTHPKTPEHPSIDPSIELKTSKESISIDPIKTALVPIDTQNYFLSPALGRPSSSVGLAAVHRLVKVVIPACRKAGIRVAWLTYGLEEKDIAHMPPMMVVTTKRDTNFDRRSGGGVYGADLGKVMADGEEIEAGRALMRDQWNTELFPSLKEVSLPEDLFLYKNRLSGFWRGLQNTEVLKGQGIRTLIFAGANLDQCVAASLLDAFHEGFDVILLKDAAVTTSPEWTTKCIQWNCELGWGFVVTCEELQHGVEAMLQARPKSDGV